MSEPASESLGSIDVRGSRVKRIVFGVILAAVLVAGGVVVWKLVTNEAGAKACERLAELRETDPLADKVVELLERYVESHVGTKNLVKGHTAVEVTGSTPDERCHSAINYLDRAMGHSQFMRIVDCIADAKTARSAASCL